MKVLAALSGGVDSSVAAAILKSQGHEVVGVTMKLWGGESDTGCCSVSDVEDARRAAAQVDVEHHVFNFGDEFDQHVVQPYVADHAAGRTPNPCVECNRHLKFDVLLRRAELLGFDAVATGHHAQIVTLADGSRRIGRGEDERKDQSYVLYPLTSAELDRVMFPIGHLTKAEVRTIAAELELRTAAKPESQDVCFITRTDGRQAFLEERTELHRGRIVDTQGDPVGTVDAIELVTVGQRRGLNLAGGADRRFVVDVDVPAATVTIGSAADLQRESVTLTDMVWASAPVNGAVEVQTSAHGTPTPATATVCEEGTATIEWLEPQRRVAAGQSVVLYQQAHGRSVVVGGGLAV